MSSGRGNAAFEVADGIYGVTNLVHMLSRSRVRLSWETHYVGDLRYHSKETVLFSLGLEPVEKLLSLQSYFLNGKVRRTSCVLERACVRA